MLDSSAVVRFLDKEAGYKRVAEILQAHSDQDAVATISAIQWGEIAGIVRRKRGEIEQRKTLADLSLLRLPIVTVTSERAVHAAEIKVDRKIAYADCFALDLAMDSPNHLLITADYDFKAVADLAQIEFLPHK